MQKATGNMQGITGVNRQQSRHQVYPEIKLGGRRMPDAIERVTKATDKFSH